MQKWSSSCKNNEDWKLNIALASIQQDLISEATVSSKQYIDTNMEFYSSEQEPREETTTRKQQSVNMLLGKARNILHLACPTNRYEYNAWLVGTAQRGRCQSKRQRANVILDPSAKQYEEYIASPDSSDQQSANVVFSSIEAQSLESTGSNQEKMSIILLEE